MLGLPCPLASGGHIATEPRLPGTPLRRGQIIPQSIHCSSHGHDMSVENGINQLCWCVFMTQIVAFASFSLHCQRQVIHTSFHLMDSSRARHGTVRRQRGHSHSAHGHHVKHRRQPRPAADASDSQTRSVPAGASCFGTF